MWEKLKGELATDRTFYVVLIVLVGLSAFALGRYSAPGTPPVTVWGGGVATPAAVSLAPVGLTVATGTVVQPAPSPSPKAATGAYVASHSGTKYHDVRCGSAARIAEANRVYFATEAAARAAGYTPAANCALLTP